MQVCPCTLTRGTKNLKTLLWEGEVSETFEEREIGPSPPQVPPWSTQTVPSRISAPSRDRREGAVPFKRLPASSSVPRDEKTGSTSQPPLPSVCLQTDRGQKNGKIRRRWAGTLASGRWTYRVGGCEGEERRIQERNGGPGRVWGQGIRHLHWELHHRHPLRSGKGKRS